MKLKIYWKRLVVVLTLLSFVTGIVYDQRTNPTLTVANLSVQITDALTQQPIYHAFVEIDNATYHITDQLGNALFNGLVPGQLYHIYIHGPGYPNYNTTVVPSGGTTPVKILMTASPSVGWTLTGGNQQPCTWFVSMDGTTPYARAGVAVSGLNPGDGKTGSLGQDPAQFVMSLLGSSQRVCFSNQKFIVNSPFNLTTANNDDTFSGSGMFSTIIQQSTTYARCGCQQATGGVFENAAQSTTGVQNITIQNLAIDGNKGNRAFVVDDEGIRFDGATNALNVNIYIDHVYMHDTTGGCIQSRYINHFVVSNFLLENCNTAGQGGIYHGIYCIRCWNFIYSDGIATGMADGSGVKVGLQSYDGTIANVISIKNAKDGFEMSGGTGTDLVHDIVYTGDVGDNNTLNGFDGNVGNGLVRLSIALSEFSFNTINGIILNGVNDSSINGGVIFHNGSGWQGIRMVTGGAPGDNRIAITGTRIGDNLSGATQGTAIYMVSDTSITITGGIFTYGAGYGVEAQSVNGLRVSFNDLTHNAGSPAYKDDGGNTNLWVQGNNGYNPQSPFAVTAGASVFTTTAQPYPSEIDITATNGLTTWTCRGIAQSTNIAGTWSPVLNPGDTCALTWTTTAPTYEVYPQ